VLNLVKGLRDLLERGKDLPTLPLVVLQLHSTLDAEHSDLAAVAAIVERDPALTARLLRVANSALYTRGGGRIGSVRTAVAMLGIGQLRAMCLVLAVVKLFQASGQGVDHDEFWRHASAVGLTAKFLAGHLESAAGLVPDDMYVAGLLHDVGLLVLDQFFPKQLAAVCQAAAEQEQPLWRVEAERLGLDPGEVGALLLGRWGLPQGTVDAVADHHHPDEASEAHRPAARLIRAAEALSSAGPLALSAEGRPDAGPFDVLGELGMEPAAAAEVIEGLGGIGDKAKAFAGSF